MGKIINSKMHIIGAAIVVAITIALVFVLDGKSFPDWISPLSVETTDTKSGTPTANARKDYPIAIPPMGGSNLEKEINDIRQKGDLMIERADALVAKYRTKDTALANSTTKQRIDDLKARLEHSDSE